MSKRELFNKINKNSGVIVCLLLLTLCFVQYLLYPLCKGYDFPYHYNRFYTLIDSLKDGTFPTYMDYYVLDGYGYLVKNFYSDFLFLPFALLSFIIGIPASFNAMILSSTFFCGLFSFYGFKAVQKNNFGALIFTLLFCTCTYRLFDLYQRGAYGEAFAITFLPLIYWGLYEILAGNYRKFHLLSIGMSLLIYTHSLTTSIVALSIAVVLLCNIRTLLNDKSRLKYFFTAVGLTVALCMYYFLPFIQLILFDTYKFSVPMFGQLFTNKFGYVLGGSFRLFEIPTAGYTPKIGLLVVFPPILLRCLLSRKESIFVRKTDPFLIIGLVLIAMCTHFFPWHLFPFTLFAFVQFSYRLFPFISLLLIFCTATYLIILANRLVKKVMVFFLLLFLVLFSMSGESTYYTYFSCGNNPPAIDVDTEHTALLGGEFLPLNFNDSTDFYTHDRGRYTIEYKNNNTKIFNIEKGKGNLNFDLIINRQDTLILPLTYYLGYEITLDGNKIDYQSSNGLITILPKKSGHVSTKYVGSPLQMIGFCISIVSFIVLFIFIYRWKKKGLLT